MKRTHQTVLKFISSQKKKDDFDDSSSDIDDSDRDKDYTPATVESESEANETDQPSTSKFKKKKSKHSKIVSFTKQGKTDNETVSPAGDSESLLIKSKYSEHFNITLLSNNVRLASCILCKKSKTQTDIKMSKSNTSGLKWHLKTKHPQEFALFFPTEARNKLSSAQSTLDNIFKTKPKMVSPITDEDIVKWMSLKYLPFNFFDDEPTQFFFNKLNPCAMFPKRTALREKVLKTFALAQNKVIDILKDTKSKISFTIDGWTSINFKSYYGITAHFIDKSWNIHSAAIDFLPSHGHHTGSDIAKVFYTSAQEYKIIEKIQGITVDNAAANTTFIEELENLIKKDYPDHPFKSEDSHFRCFAHIINLGVQDTLKLLKLENENIEKEKSDDEEEEDDTNQDIELSPLMKIRYLFKKTKKSEQLQNLLKTLCDAANIKYISVNIDVSTRWNSTCDMLNVAIRLKKALNTLTQSNEDLSRFFLSEDQWKLVDIVCKFLKYFKTLSTTLCGETYSTLPMVIVGFNILLDKLESFLMTLNIEAEENIVERTLIEAFQAGRDKMLKHYYKTNWVYCAALVLDPRHKIETFNLTLWGREIKKGSLKKFEEIYYLYYVKQFTTIREPEQENDSSSGDEFMAGLYKKTTSNDVDIARAEYERYINGERASRDTDILKWWREHEEIFPNLAEMARDILAIPATSVPAERLFSKAGLIIRKHRNRLNAESAKTLLCLNSWYSGSINKEIFKK